jgi:tetratricopeptide (TPR) repeat protein
MAWSGIAGAGKMRKRAFALALLGWGLGWALGLAAAEPLGGREALVAAVQDLRAGRLTQAAKSLQALVQAQPGGAEAQFYLGQCLYHLDRLGEAQPHLQAALALDPAMPATRFYLGRLAYDQGRLPEAFEQLRQADALDAGLPMVHYYLGLVYHANGQAEPAWLEFAKALELDPTLARAAYALAVERWQGGDRPAALAALKRAQSGKMDAALRKKVQRLWRRLQEP